MESVAPDPRDMCFTISETAKMRSAVLWIVCGLVLVGLTTLVFGKTVLILREAAAAGVRGDYLIVTGTVACLIGILDAAVVGVMILVARQFKELSGVVQINERWIDVGNNRIMCEYIRSVEVEAGLITIRYLRGGRMQRAWIPLTWLPPGAWKQVELRIKGVIKDQQRQQEKMGGE